MNIVSIPRYAAMTLSCKPLNLISYHIIAIAIGNQIYWYWSSSSNLFFSSSFRSAQCHSAVSQQSLSITRTQGKPCKKQTKPNKQTNTEFSWNYKTCIHVCIWRHNYWQCMNTAMLPEQKIIKANAKSVKACLRTWVCSDMCSCFCLCYQCVSFMF